MAKSRSSFTGVQLSVLVILRVAIGWLMLYEGIGRVMNASWSMTNYLSGSRGFMAEFFKSLAAQTSLMSVLGIINQWGLILIGMGLIFGLLSKYFSLLGLVFVLIGYLSHPPFLGLSYTSIIQGSYLIVNELFILFFLFLLFILFPTSHQFGLDRLIFGKK
jgi:thiosulfate dehydrogenase [quinone] large subunit